MCNQNHIHLKTFAQILTIVSKRPLKNFGAGFIHMEPARWVQLCALPESYTWSGFKAILQIHTNCVLFINFLYLSLYHHIYHLNIALIYLLFCSR